MLIPVEGPVHVLARVIGTARTISNSIGVSEAAREIFEEEAGEYHKPRVMLSC
jgi:hypothetical protein